MDKTLTMEPVTFKRPEMAEQTVHNSKTLTTVANTTASNTTVSNTSANDVSSTLKMAKGNPMSRPFYFVSGLICLLLALIGIPLPLLPTTPFVLLAAFCFSKSSPRFHQWLLNNRIFGPMIHDWESYGVIPKKAKILATVMMLTMVSYPLFFRDLPLWAVCSVVVVVIVALSYIWSRPSYPKATSVDIHSTATASSPSNSTSAKGKDGVA